VRGPRTGTRHDTFRPTAPGAIPVSAKFARFVLACLLCAAVITLVVLLAKRLSGR